MSSETSLPWLVHKTSQALRSAVKKTRLNSSKQNFIAKSFRLPTKRKLSVLLNFLFPFVSFIGVFPILKCKTLVLKTTTWWTRASHFVDGWHLQKCQIRFFPHPLNGWHDHWTFVGESGMGNGWFYWFSLRVFSLTPLDLEFEIFSPRYNGVGLYVMSDIFFGAGCCFPVIYLHAFFLPKSACRTFFSEITNNPLKSQMVTDPKIHQTFGQLTDSDLSIISKGFWNNRGQNSLGERGGIRFYLPLPGESVRSYVGTDVRWRHNQIFSDR